ncbi:MAG: rod shape-determining protein RodA [Sumerlaeia bacterium]
MAFRRQQKNSVISPRAASSGLHPVLMEDTQDPPFRLATFLAAARYMDWILLGSVVLLTVLGLWLLFGCVQGNDALVAAAGRQITWFGIALCGLAAALMLDYRWLGRLAPWAYIANLGLLVFVLIAGTTVNGARSWFRLGPVSFQPSETMKVVTVLLLAQYWATRPHGVRGIKDLILPGIIVAIPMMLILKQPDLGTASLFIILFFGMMYWAGVKRWILIALILGGIASCASVVPFLKDYQKERLLTFVDPGRDPTGSGYNVRQSLIAVGNGGLTGRGWGEGTQAVLRYLPEAHTDFIFASSVEQTGLAGAIVIIGLYGVILLRFLRAAENARDRFGGLVVIGLGAILLGHVTLNIGMTIGLLPVTGLPLPFLSYGGSFLLSCYILMGLVLNIAMRRFFFQ